MINFLVKEYHYVYWIRLNGETDKQKGYIGVTRDIRKRVNQHMTKITGTVKEYDSVVSREIAKLDLDSFAVDVIFAGTKQECLALEKELRPNRYIGWNMAIGGGASYNPGKHGRPVVSKETRNKLSKAHTGKKLGRDSIAKGVRKHTKEDKLRIGLQHKGKTISEGQKAKFRETIRYSNKNGKFIALKYKNRGITCIFDSVQRATRFLQDEGVPIGISTLKSVVQRRGVKLRATYDWCVDYETSHPLLGAKDLVDLANKKQKRLDYESGVTAQLAHGKHIEIIHKDNPDEVIKCASTKVACEYFNLGSAGLRVFIKKHGLMSYHHSGYAVVKYEGVVIKENVKSNSTLLKVAE